MHEAVIDFVRQWAPDGPVRVLDIGGAKVSTERYYTGPHVRDLFPQAVEYVVMDINPGPTVDVVADATRIWTVPHDLGSFDVVVCTEVLEHVRDWVKLLVTCREMLRLHGRLILTCGGPGRVPHSSQTEGEKPTDEFYGNVSHPELRKALEHIGFTDILTYQVGLDTQATAVR